MDPLSVLREFSVAKQLDQVEVDDTRVRFGERYSFPRNVQTGYRRHGGGAYTLHTLVYLLKQPANYQWMSYIKSAREAGVPQVAFPDRKEVQDYLTGAIDHSDKIQLTAPELLLPLAGEEGADAPPAKRARTDAADDSGAGEAAPAGEGGAARPPGKERALRDRNSQMCVPGRSFRPVLEILHMAERQREARERAPAARGGGGRPGAPAPAKEKRALPVLPSGRFDRPAEQNPKGAFRIHPGGPPPPPLPVGPGPPPPPPPAANAGQPPPPPRPHAGSSSSRHARPPSRHSAEKPQQRPGSSSSGGGGGSAGRRPIIIVPAAPSAKLNMLNIKGFLEKGVFTPPEAARKEGAKKETSAVAMRRFGRPQPVAYEVTDRAPPAKSHDWRRVVAVFVTGAAWQFKDWPFLGAAKGEMAATFHQVLGVHVGLKNERVPDTVKAWNVRRFLLHPVERHGDQSVVLEIFGAIDAFLAKRQKGSQAPDLAY